MDSESNIDKEQSIAYIYSRKLVDECNKISQINNRVRVILTWNYLNFIFNI